MSQATSRLYGSTTLSIHIERYRECETQYALSLRRVRISRDYLMSYESIDVSFNVLMSTRSSTARVRISTTGACNQLLLRRKQSFNGAYSNLGNLDMPLLSVINQRIPLGSIVLDGRRQSYSCYCCKEICICCKYVSKNASIAWFIMLSLSFDKYTIPFSQTDISLRVNN